MKSIEIVAYKREDLGKKESRKLRNEALVPTVVYGGEKVVHCAIPMILFRELIYTPDVYLVDLNVEGEIFKCILQDYQVHPVSEVLLHADFLAVDESRPVKMEIPVKFVGTSPGVKAGGKLVTKMRSLKVLGLPQDMPDFIEVSVEGLALGKSVKVKDIVADKITILNTPLVTVGTVEIPRALKSAQAGGETAE